MSDVSYPTSTPVLAVRDMVVFPGVVVPITVGRDMSVHLVQDAVESGEAITVATQRDMERDEITPSDLYEVGTLCKIHHMLQLPSNTLKIMVQGVERVRIGPFTQQEPYFRADVTPMPDQEGHDRVVEAMMHNVTQLLQRYGENLQGFPEELVTIALNLEDPNKLAYLLAFNLHFKLAERQALLEAEGARAKLDLLSEILTGEMELHQLGASIQSQVQTTLGKTQKEYFLREQLRAIQKELGESDERIAEVSELREKIDQAKLPPEVLKEAERELGRLEKLPPGAAEHTVIRTYLDWIIALPWARSTPDQLDIQRAREILDEDHYDLDLIKKRILEYLAVYKLKHERLGETSLRGPILCLVGPPGVGKTSLGQSIARALGRKFVRMSLGGMRDEAEIRGHRRTYIGALPGRLIQAISRSGSNNPVFMLDEIDKLGADFRGDPASALLEVLDPEQNRDFRDHYLDVPFDLSRVLFIATANVLDPVPPALRDRMEVLQLSGYTAEEKVAIAEQYLVPKQLKEHALAQRELKFTPEGLRALIADYTHEAGVRGLEREVASICRKVSVELTTGSQPRRGVLVTPARARQYLGKRRFYPEEAERPDLPGIVTGLAWTEAGGDILFIEATATPGTGQLRLTGKLGEVMKESAQAALSYVWSKAAFLGIPADFFGVSDVHLHVPAGAIPKDGPSAGIAMATAIASLASSRLVRAEIAMTGEITLRGRVLPVGGIKEKVLAARRAGIRTVILPRHNEPDLADIPGELLREMKLILVDTVDGALASALCPVPRRPRKRA
ncbi:MAG TPA: endopeptidase La [Pantanalinema sp.]